MSKKYLGNLDEAADSYFNDTPPSEWSYLGFLEALKPVWMSSARGVTNAENSSLRKRFCNILKRILSEEQENEKGEVATLLLQTVWGAVPTVQYPAVAQLWGVLSLPGVMGAVPSDEMHGVKKFWECVNLDKQVANEWIIVKKKTELDTIKVLDTARTNEVDDLVNQFEIERKQKKIHKGLASNFEKLVSDDRLELDEPIIGQNENKESVEEGTSQEDLLNSVTETLITFGKLKFPIYYDKLKTIQNTSNVEANYYVIDMGDKDTLNQVHELLSENELRSLFERLILKDEDEYMSAEARSYMELFDQIVEEKGWDDLVYDDQTEDMEGDNNINKYTTNFRNIEEFEKYFLCEQDIATKIDIPSNGYKADGVLEFFERPRQIPLFLLEVSEGPNNLDPNKINVDRKKLMDEGVFVLNKFMISTELATWKVCETLNVFLDQGFADKIEIGRLIFIGPGLYLFSPFTIPALTIPTSFINLEHAPRLVQTLLCLRYNIIKKIEWYKEFSKEGQ
nr:5864_t:CDS:2 [Entrophospora candida]